MCHFKCNNPAKIRRANSLNGQSGRAQSSLHVSILIHLRVFFLPLRPSARFNYPVSLPVSRIASYAVKLVHLALCSFLLTLRTETSRWKRIAFRPTVFPLTKVILMGRKRRQSARLLQSGVSTEPRSEIIGTKTNWKQTALHCIHVFERSGRAHVPCGMLEETQPLRPNALYFRSIIKFSLSTSRCSRFTKTAKTYARG